MATMGRKIRYKKLNVRTPLEILREDQIDRTEYESLTQEGVGTGVDAAEEREYHLQTVLQGSGLAADNEIPVPPPEQSALEYDELYPESFTKTSTYIRFSQTVEECIGCLYDMTEEDDNFLKSYNQGKSKSAQLSEDNFEKIMEVYEDTAYVKTPFGHVDQAIASYEEMLQGLTTDLGDTKITSHAREIYDYWRTRREALQNRPLHPSLKFETHQESDELDPYVCFRRREVRQTRKTRARDSMSADKLKKLRRELEDGRQLVLQTQAREIAKADMLKTDRAIFEQRALVKDEKGRLGIKTDDEDLINQKPHKKKAPEFVAMQRPVPTQLRLPVRPDGRPADADLMQLSTRIAEREKELRLDIENKVQTHSEWNKNHVDLTTAPLSPVKGPKLDISFRSAKTQYLMTPPASASSESLDEPTPMDLDVPEKKLPIFEFKDAADGKSSSTRHPAYRRRIGRLNRLWIDRRGLSSPPQDARREQSDRWRYDQSSDEDETPVYEVDPFDMTALQFRAGIPLPLWMTGRGGRPVSGEQAAGQPTSRPPLPAPGTHRHQPLLIPPQGPHQGQSQTVPSGRS